MKINLLVFPFLAASLLAASCQKPPVKAPETKNQEATIDNNESKLPDNAVMKITDEKLLENADKKAGSYKDYSPGVAAEEQKAERKVVLFFYAPWCPYCRAADEAFKTNLNKIPTGVTLLKTNYDSEASLKLKYGVTYQHTFVQINGNGDQITKWISGDVDLLNKNIK